MNKMFNQVKMSARKASDYVNNKTLALAVMASPFLAHAQSDPFATTVTEAKAKIAEYGGALIGVAAAGVVLMIGVKYVKKIRGAA